MSRYAIGLVLTLASFGSTASCSDLSTPADLDREQILAVRATPSILVPGKSVVLDTLVAGPTGPMVGDETWQLQDDHPGLSLQEGPGGKTMLSCAAGVAAEGEVALRLEFALSEGQVLLAHKVVLLGSLERPNPMIERLVVGEREMGEDETIALNLGETSLAIRAPEATRVAWYSSVGEIQYYRDVETTVEVDEEDPAQGWLAAVVRDEMGGVSWRSVRVEEE